MKHRRWGVDPIGDVLFYQGANTAVIPSGWKSARREILSENGGSTMNTPSKETMAKYLQLTHWNKLLYEKGVITQREYLRMANMIRQKYPVTP